MLTDDEQYREKLLHGYFLAQTSTTKGSPASRSIGDRNAFSNQMLLNSSYHGAGSGTYAASYEIRPVTASNSNKKG